MEKLKTRTLYRDGLEESIVGKVIVSRTDEGHVVESYKLADGQRRFFVTLSGSHLCAHGDTVASAISDAVWKDPAQRPSMDALKAEIISHGKARKITLNEFRLLTGACLTGCREALKKAGRDESPMTAREIRDHVSREWGDKLISVLGWTEVSR